MPNMSWIRLLLLFVLTYPSSLGVRASDWVEDCHRKGFDPFQLHCETCNLLATESHQENCRDCCQAYQDTPRIRKPYEAAVLVIQRPTGGELEEFLGNDWDELVEAKSSQRLLKLNNIVDDPVRMINLFGFPSATLMFLDQPLQKAQSASAYEKQAKEVIVLDGWKRDDIKDMLMTLLP